MPFPPERLYVGEEYVTEVTEWLKKNYPDAVTRVYSIESLIIAAKISPFTAAFLSSYEATLISNADNLGYFEELRRQNAAEVQGATPPSSIFGETAVQRAHNVPWRDASLLDQLLDELNESAMNEGSDIEKLVNSLDHQKSDILNQEQQSWILTMLQYLAASLIPF